MTLSELIRAFCRKTMLPWNLTQNWAWRARLYMYSQATRIERQEKVISDWWDATHPRGVMEEDVQELKRLLAEEEHKP